jgi:hypothetical protein
MRGERVTIGNRSSGIGPPVVTYIHDHVALAEQLRNLLHEVVAGGPMAVSTYRPQPRH